MTPWLYTSTVHRILDTLGPAAHTAAAILLTDADPAGKPTTPDIITLLQKQSNLFAGLEGARVYLQLQNAGFIDRQGGIADFDQYVPGRPPRALAPVGALSNTDWAALKQDASEILNFYRAAVRKGDKGSESMDLILFLLQSGRTKEQLIAAVRNYVNDPGTSPQARYRKIAHHFFLPDFVEQWFVVPVAKARQGDEANFAALRDALAAAQRP